VFFHGQDLVLAPLVKSLSSRKFDSFRYEILSSLKYCLVIWQEGFRYHHAEPNYLMLVRWLPETLDTIPMNASHRVGVGAFVLNDKREVTFCLAILLFLAKRCKCNIWFAHSVVLRSSESDSSTSLQ